MRDPYAVLGVGKSASEADVKKAFRKLTKAHHPDQNQNDPKAKERFAEVNAAYEILGDKDKRAKFDRGEIDAEGKPRFHGFEGFGGGQPRGGHPGGGFESFSFGFGPEGPFGGARGGGGGAADMFSEMFEQAMRGRGQPGGGRARQQAPQKGGDIEAELSLSLESLVSGGHTRVTLPNGKMVEVAIPPQAGDGKTIRLKGQGHPSMMGSPAGDLLLTIRLQKHPRFTVDGTDLRARQDVPLPAAVLGGPVRIDTLEGAVELTIPPMTSGGRT
ncbi:MAG: DnaJ C-terminal domain-containing protein, partial [Beijerinckiaceae bacterium]